jgi:DNA-binding NarL/FixJ family response regulator
MIRVVLVDDQTLVRQGVRSLLQLSGEVEVIGECADGAEALSQIPQLKPDVVLLDVRMPARTGLQVIEGLAAQGALPPTIILTTFDDDEVVLEGIQLGAKGYLLKDVSLEQLTEAIRTVARGDRLVQPAITARLLQRLQRRGAAPAPPSSKPLTQREVEILRLIAGGYSSGEIGRALGVAEGTIKNHTASILSKLGARDRTRAVLKALELGYLAPATAGR